MNAIAFVKYLRQAASVKFSVEKSGEAECITVGRGLAPAAKNKRFGFTAFEC